jgi:CHAT domain-containing protein
MHHHPDLGSLLHNLAGLYQIQDRYAEAEALHRRSLTITEKAYGPEHPYMASGLGGLAVLYLAQGRFAEAEPLLRRSVAILEKALGPEHHDLGTFLIYLAELYLDQRRYGEAAPLLKRTLAIYEKSLGPEHAYVAPALGSLAGLYQVQGRYAEAEALHRRSLTISEKAYGPEHVGLGKPLRNLAELYQAQGRLAEAEPLLRRALGISEKVLGPDHRDVAISLKNLALLALAQHDWGRAADYWRRSTGVIERRAERGLASTMESSSEGEAQRLGWFFAGLVRTTHRLAAEGHAPGGSAAEMFVTAQWAQASEAAASLAQMAARSAAGSPELAGLVRERQDLVGEWQATDKLLFAAKAQEPAERKADRLSAIDARLTEIGRKLANDFPNHTALASAAPVSVADIQAQLGADEALVLFLDTPAWSNSLPEETFVWVVTRSEVRWVRSDLGTAALQREVEALRCGLDHSPWNDENKHIRCFWLLNVQHDNDRGNVLPFPAARAHALYKALFGEVADLIAGKHLLIVPSGALTQLPFQVLVTAAPSGVRPPGSDTIAPTPDHKTTLVRGGATVSDPLGLAPYREAAWLGARQSITVLPAVSSLKALRAHAKARRAGKVYLGIGNPLLDGPDARFAELARKARASMSCPATPRPMATLNAAQGGAAPVELRGGLANVADIRSQTPLPETADELCAVARDLKTDPSEVRLGDRATETEVKRLSRSGELARYRVLHFATHGAMAGELDKDREPGLILTPPDKASAEDDGYLAASEIAALKLDADWVILSACNTAAQGATSAEALSGIARAFIYAGARALLVSHWAVDSNAAVKLITTAATEMARDPSIGRAEAMRRAMQAMIENGAAHEAHPAFWAPFVVVGEGAAAR